MPPSHPQMHNLYLPDLPAHDLSSDFVLLAEQILIDRESKVSKHVGGDAFGRDEGVYVGTWPALEGERMLGVGSVGSVLGGPISSETGSVDPHISSSHHPPSALPPTQAKVSLAPPNAPSSSLTSLWFQRQTLSSDLAPEEELQVAASSKQSPAHSAVQLLDMLLSGGKAGPGCGGRFTLYPPFNQRG